MFYESGKFNSDIIQLLVKFLFRTVGHKTTKLSNFAYTNKFKDIRQKIFENKDYDYYDDIIEVFRKNIGRLAEKEFFLDNSLHNKINISKSTYILLFIETCISSDINIIPIKDNSLEHIFSQDEKGQLEKVDISILGNLTLLELKIVKTDIKVIVV